MTETSEDPCGNGGAATRTRPRPALDFRVYLVTDRARCGSLGVVGTVRIAVHHGATVVQLRDPGATDAELVGLGRELVRELEPAGVALLVNDRPHLVAPIGAAGVHLGQGDLDAATGRARLGPEAVIGLSAQTLDHVESARSLAGGISCVNYLGVGPIWSTDSKSDAAPPCGTAHLACMVSASPWPVVAIGGITPERTAEVRASGAAGIATISGICGQSDVGRATRALRTAWDRATAGPGGRRRGSHT